MNKGELVSRISDQTGYTKSSVNEILNLFESNVKHELSKGGSVALRGFGTFSTAKRKAYTCIDPQGRKVKVPSKKVPTFKAHKELKSAVSKKR